MAYNLNNEKEQVLFGKDGLVFPLYEQSTVLPAGRALDVTDVTEKVLNAGHVIITKDGVYKPMPITTEGAYAALPEGWSYAGFLGHSMLTSKPSASIVIGGLVNDSKDVLPYDIATIKAAIKTALPSIVFTHDEAVDTAE